MTLSIFILLYLNGRMSVHYRLLAYNLDYTIAFNVSLGMKSIHEERKTDS